MKTRLHAEGLRLALQRAGDHLTRLRLEVDTLSSQSMEQFTKADRDRLQANLNEVEDNVTVIKCKLGLII